MDRAASSDGSNAASTDERPTDSVSLASKSNMEASIDAVGVDRGTEAAAEEERVVEVSVGVAEGVEGTAGIWGAEGDIGTGAGELPTVRGSSETENFTVFVGVDFEEGSRVELETAAGTGRRAAVADAGRRLG